VFDKNAQANGFSKIKGGWYKQTTECIAILELQKSQFGIYYLLRIKTFVQGFFNKSYLPTNKELIQDPLGDVYSREPEEYMNVFNLDEPMNDDIREKCLEKLFQNYIVPFTNKTLTIAGIKKMVECGEFTMLPAVKKEFAKIGILIN
jgi:hypothetical protein